MTPVHLKNEIMKRHLILLIIVLSVLLSCNRRNDEYPKLLRIETVPYLKCFSTTQFDTLLDAENYSRYRFSDKLVMKIQYPYDSTVNVNDTTRIYYPNDDVVKDSLYISFYRIDPFSRISFDEAQHIDPYFVNGLNKFSIFGKEESPFICRDSYYAFVDMDGRKQQSYNRWFLIDLSNKIHHLFHPYRYGTLSVFDRNYDLIRNIHFLSDDLLFYKPVSFAIIKDRYAVISTREVSKARRLDENAVAYYLYFVDIANEVVISRTMMDSYCALESINDTLYMAREYNGRLQYSRFDFSEEGL